MTFNVLLGGNGYIGREVSSQRLDADPEARFVVISSSGKNSLVSDRVTTVAADATSYEALAEALPERFDTIVNFLGHPAKSEEENQRINVAPVRAMKRLAQERGADAIGYVGGILGPRSFTETKKRMIEDLRDSGLPVAVVEPTIVYGGGRRDTLSRMVPLFKFLGLFSATFKPVLVSDVAAGLVGQLRDATNRA